MVVLSSGQGHWRQLRLHHSLDNITLQDMSHACGVKVQACLCGGMSSSTNLLPPFLCPHTPLQPSSHLSICLTCSNPPTPTLLFYPHSIPSPFFSPTLPSPTFDVTSFKTWRQEKHTVPLAFYYGMLQTWGRWRAVGCVARVPLYSPTLHFLCAVSLASAHASPISSLRLGLLLLVHVCVPPACHHLGHSTLFSLSLSCPSQIFHSFTITIIGRLCVLVRHATTCSIFMTGLFLVFV